MRPEIKEFMEALKAKTVGEAEFHQAVEEVIETVWDTYQANPKYKANKILEKMVEPERVIMFRVPWIDDKGEVQRRFTFPPVGNFGRIEILRFRADFQKLSDYAAYGWW